MAFLLILAIVSTSLCLVVGDTICSGPSGVGGDCVPIDECPYLVSLITKSTRTKVEVELLRLAHCGFKDKSPMVCCGNISNTSCIIEDQIGNCVPLRECPEADDYPPASLRKYRCDEGICCVANLTTKCVLTAAPLDFRSGCCGRDVGGDRSTGETTIGQYPWLALIEVLSKNNTKPVCGGALISNRYVLTAAHCVTGNVAKLGTPYSVRLGDYDISTAGADCTISPRGGKRCSDEPVIVLIEKTIPHPDYVPTSKYRHHDIALVRMNNAVPYTDFIRPICLPVADMTRYKTNFTMLAAGWGASEDAPKSKIKLQVDLPYVPLETCQTSYDAKPRLIALWQGQVCAGGEWGKDVCRGDSGVPLMYETAGVFEVIGIASFGPSKCGSEGVPGVYTKIHFYLDWIRSTWKL